LSRVSVNNVASSDNKTGVTSSNIPDTDSRLDSQTSGGLFGKSGFFGFA
jgi:hypothetical protein